MKMQSVLLPTAIILSAAAASAAPISWGQAFEVATPSDLQVSGRKVVYAINGGDNVGNTGFINGVAANGPVLPAAHGPDLIINTGAQYLNFEGVAVAYRGVFAADTYGDVTPTNTTAGSVSISTAGTRTSAIPQAGFDLAWSPTYASQRNYSAASGDLNFDSLLATQLFIDGRNVSGASQSKLILRLNNLTQDTQYRLQVVVSADSRPSTSQNSANRVALDDTAGGISPEIPVYADLNGDGVKHVTSAFGTFTADASTQFFSIDLKFGRNTGISALILTTAPLNGDFNHDDIVNASDLARLIEGLSVGATTWEYGDLDLNGVVDINDFNAFSALFPNNGAGTSGNGGTVPEPAACSLLIPAAALLRRRR